jgi:YHS domain-containing protein
MSLGVAVILSLVFIAVSIAAGVYVMRFKSSITEMMGMMVGMTFGMMAGIAVGYFIGAATDMFVSNLAGVAVGIALGAGFGRVGGLMGAMDGSMGGFMGGMMGGMLGVMINISPAAVWITAVFVTVICLVIYYGLIRLVLNAVNVRYAVDPVCDMQVDIATAKLMSQYHGETVYFCAPGCKRAFDKDPEHYLARSLHSPQRSSAGGAEMTG